METWDTIRARRNVRHYTDQPVGRADLERILDAGRKSRIREQLAAMELCAVTDRPQLVELAKVWQGRGTLPGPRRRSPSSSSNRRTHATKTCSCTTSGKRRRTS
jgi:hypothetical protein